jgi:hypothetical protein
MLVRLGWPDCDYINRRRSGDPQDAYWVECSADESLPLLAARTDSPRVPLDMDRDRAFADLGIAPEGETQ